MRCRFLRVLLLAALLAPGLAACAARGADPSLDARLRRIIAPVRFSIPRWQIERLPDVFSVPSLGDLTAEQKAVLVRYYFALGQEARARERALTLQKGADGITCAHCEEDDLQTLMARYQAMRPVVQRAIAEQLEEALRQEGLANPAPGWLSRETIFPPVRFVLEGPPHVLVISPRERIERLREFLGVGDLSPAQQGALERQVEALDSALAPYGLSALVVEIGGFGGTFPTFVSDESSLHYALGAIAEEWLHQYLAFTPLGSRYVLHLLNLARNDEIARLNETAADLAAGELRDQIIARHYADLAPRPAPAEAPAAPQQPAPKRFNFGRYMRETRLEVDRLLAEGQVAQAEAYMEQRRQGLLQEGYAIRRLNQAYFAFHGTYAASEFSLDPETGRSIDPIGEEMVALRAQSSSVGEFVRAVSRLTSREALRRALANARRWPTPR